MARTFTRLCCRVFFNFILLLKSPEFLVNVRILSGVFKFWNGNPNSNCMYFDFKLFYELYYSEIPIRFQFEFGLLCTDSIVPIFFFFSFSALSKAVVLQCRNLFFSRILFIFSDSG